MLNALRQKHAAGGDEGKNYGVDINTGAEVLALVDGHLGTLLARLRTVQQLRSDTCVRMDLVQINVVEPTPVKSQLSQHHVCPVCCMSPDLTVRSWMATTA